MTLASKITVTRLLMVPVFALLALIYGHGATAGNPNEALRLTALAIFVTASASDALDGWIARRFNQRSAFGAFMDPLADKTLLLTGIVTLSYVDWGAAGWRIPGWFTGLVILRDCVIIFGLAILRLKRRQIHFHPHWSGKVCTVTQMFALGWVMLRMDFLDPLYPCLVAAVFTMWSLVIYLRQGIHILSHGRLIGA